MKASTVALVILGVAGAGVGIFFVLRKKGDPALPPPGIPTGDTHSTETKGGVQGLMHGIEDKIGNALGLPIPASQVGALAQSAPTWLKIGVLPIGATALAQTVIDNPKGAAVAAGKAAVAAPKYVYNVTGRAASSVVSAPAKVASAAAGAVGSVVKGISSLW